MWLASVKGQPVVILVTEPLPPVEKIVKVPKINQQNVLEEPYSALLVELPLLPH
jgi:hypothetical protein